MDNNLVIDRKKAWIMIAPATIFVFIFIVLPILFMLRVSFYPQSNVSAYENGFTFANYTKILTDPFYLNVIFRTFIVGFSTSIMTLIFGYPVAFCMSKLPKKKQQFLTLLIVAPLYTSIIIRCYAWTVILGEKGIINSIVTNLFGCEPTQLLYTYFAVLLGLVYVFVAFMILSIYNVLVDINPSIEEAALVLGAKPWRAFWETTLPLSLPGVFSGFLLVFILSMGAYVVPEVLGGIKLGLVPNYIYRSVVLNFNWPFGSSMAFIYILVTAVVLIVYFRVVFYFNRHNRGGSTE